MASESTPLTPSDRIFLDEVERLLHLALDRIGDVLESIQPPTKYDYPAPHLPRDPDFPPSKRELSFIPYARECLRSVKSIQVVCNLWLMLKSNRPAAATSTTDAQAQQPANPALLSMVENLFKTPIPKPTAQSA